MPAQYISRKHNPVESCGDRASSSTADSSGRNGNGETSLLKVASKYHYQTSPKPCEISRSQHRYRPCRMSLVASHHHRRGNKLLPARRSSQACRLCIRELGADAVPSRWTDRRRPLASESQSVARSVEVPPLRSRIWHVQPLLPGNPWH